jgi:hypothetical protein
MTAEREHAAEQRLEALERGAYLEAEDGDRVVEDGDRVEWDQDDDRQEESTWTDS